MDNQPLISLITVTFNAEKEIEATLESVESQTFKDYEHIIVDGQSSDNTLGIIGRHHNPRLQIHSKSDNGIYHGMNRGLKFAQGKYLLFLNAGDRFASRDTLAKYAEAAKEDPDIIYGDTVIVDSKGNILRKRHLDAPDILTFNSFLNGMLVCHQAFMVKREIAPFYDRNFKLSADYDWCLRCIAKSDVMRRKNLKAVTIHYLDGGMSQKKKRESLRERFVIMKRHFGLWNALSAHIGFVPRLLKRNLMRVSSSSNKGSGS